MKAILGRKIGMTQIFNSEGNTVPVTLIEAGPCVVTQIKTAAVDGYAAVQIGFGTAKKVAKPQAGHFKPSKAESKFTREYRTQDLDPAAATEAEVSTETETLNHQVGDVLTVTEFENVTSVDVTGISKGKGFAGTIKRHNFSRGPKTHGSRNYREPGSIGSGYPEHVLKGMRMAGHMGHERVTTKHLKVIQILPEENLLVVKGAVPGPRKGLVMIKARTLAKTEATS